MRLLLVEDDRKLAAYLAKGLRENGYAVDCAHDGLDGAHLALSEPYDVIILDIMLPERNGYQVLDDIRKSGKTIPVLCLSARDAVSDRVTGLDAGADDYVVKPFHFSELLARLRALQRRPAQIAPSVLRCGDLVLDPAAHTVERGSKPVELTPKEFSLLAYLMRNGGSVITRTAIIENVWDMNFESLTNVVDVFINRLRNKIDHPFETPLIHTVRGVGYMLKCQDA